MSESFIHHFLNAIPREGNEGIHHVVADLSRRAGIEAPALYASNGRHFMLEMMPAAAMSVGEKSMILLNHGMLNDLLGGGVDFTHHTTVKVSCGICLRCLQ